MYPRLDVNQSGDSGLSRATVIDSLEGLLRGHFLAVVVTTVIAIHNYQFLLNP